jgi:glycosyltransferase involved in cell wall biosynthesis
VPGGYDPDMAQPTICHLIGSPVRGAPRVMMHQLAAAVDTSKYRTAVAFVREGADEAAAFGLPSMLPEFEALGVPVCVAGMERVWQLGGSRALDSFFRATHTRLIVSHLHRADAWNAALGWWGRAHSIRVLHITEDYWDPAVTGADALARAAEIAINRRCDRIVCVSTEIRDRVVDQLGADPDRVLWIPGGVDVDAFACDRAPFSGGGAPVVGLACRLDDSHKGLFDFVDAAAVVQRHRPDVRFVVAGDGPDAGEMRRRAAAAGVTIEFVGHVDDVAGLLASFDVFVQPSRREGTPYAVLEAAAAGRALVVTAVGGMRDVVTDGVSGRLVPQGAPQVLAQVLCDVVDDPDGARRMGAAAARRATDFSVQRMCERWEPVYDAVLAGD